MNKKQLKEYTGSFSKPSKMPGYSYGLPAWECQTGGKLSKIKGTVCYDCYAKKGFYAMYKTVKEAQYKRFKAIDRPKWVHMMASQIKLFKTKEFRWHDAGDIKSVKHLLKIFKVCKLTPGVKHWMPTKEAQYLKKIPVNRVPKNLIIRLSGTNVDGPAGKFWKWTSTVTTNPKKATCPAPKQGGKCLDCRKCWSRKIKNITYLKH